jgi:hypothetical protein
MPRSPPGEARPPQGALIDAESVATIQHAMDRGVTLRAPFRSAADPLKRFARARAQAWWPIAATSWMTRW